MQTINCSFILPVSSLCTWENALHYSAQSQSRRFLNSLKIHYQKSTVSLGGFKTRKCFTGMSSNHLGSEDIWSSPSNYVNSLNAESGSDSASEDDILGFSTSLFEDSFPIETEEEIPPEYVLPPSIGKTDLEFNRKLENAVYILRYVLPGPVRKHGMENELSDACGLLHNEIRFQDSRMCIHGKERLLRWLQILAEADAVLDLHEIYSENIKSHPEKGSIYAIWTLTLPAYQWQNEIQNIEASTGSSKEPQKIMLSGQSKVDINSNGQVTSVHFEWHDVKEGKMVEAYRLVQRYPCERCDGSASRADMQLLIK